MVATSQLTEPFFLWELIHEEDQRILDIVAVCKGICNLHLTGPDVLLDTLTLVLEVVCPDKSFLGLLIM